MAMETVLRDLLLPLRIKVALALLTLGTLTTHLNLLRCLASRHPLPQLLLRLILVHSLGSMALEYSIDGRYTVFLGVDLLA